MNCFCLLELLTDDRFDLCASDAVVLASLDERSALLVERRLRREKIEERGGAESVSLLLDSQVFFSGRHRCLLNLDALQRRAE